MDAPPATPTTAAHPPGPPRRAQVALGVCLAVLFGLLAVRGYGNSLGLRPAKSTKVAQVDVNRAEVADLEQVPGIGPGLARRITDHRREKGPFKSVEELRQVKGIGPATFDKVRAFVRVEQADPSVVEPLPEPLVLERRPMSPGSTSRSTGTGAKLQPGDPPIDVNMADTTDLMRLPGVGPKMAHNIVAARAEKLFTSVEDLDRVKGIGPKTLEKLRPFVIVKEP